MQTLRYFISREIHIQTAITQKFRQLILFLVFFPRVWKFEIFQCDHHKVRTWNEPLFAGELLCMHAITALSKNQHYLLSSLWHPICIWNTHSINLPICIPMGRNLFYYQTKAQVDFMLGYHLIETKWIGYKSLLFAKINEPWCKWVNSCCSIGSWIMHSSLRSSCIMFHEPIEKHALTHTYTLNKASFYSTSRATAEMQFTCQLGY